MKQLVFGIYEELSASQSFPNIYSVQFTLIARHFRDPLVLFAASVRHAKFSECFQPTTQAANGNAVEAEFPSGLYSHVHNQTQ